MDHKLCNRLIDDMFTEIETAEEYKSLMCHYKDHDDMEKCRLFKDMALEEIKHFEALHNIIGAMLTEEEKTDPGCFKILHDRYAEKYKCMKEELNK